jgi:ethanolamine utilization microcompartment shell protein EutS
MRNGTVKVMSYMSASDFVVEEIDKTPGVKFVVGTVDCVECSLDEVVVVVGEVWNVNVGVLEPERVR